MGTEIYGPQTDELDEFYTSMQSMSEAQANWLAQSLKEAQSGDGAKRLASIYNATINAATVAGRVDQWHSAWRRGVNVLTDLPWHDEWAVHGNAYAAGWDRVWENAAIAITFKDLISTEDFDALYGPWQMIMDSPIARGLHGVNVEAINTFVMQCRRITSDQITTLIETWEEYETESWFNAVTEVVSIMIADDTLDIWEGLCALGALAVYDAVDIDIEAHGALGAMKDRAAALVARLSISSQSYLELSQVWLNVMGGD